MKNDIIDLTGRRFGKLVALDFFRKKEGSKQYSVIVWKCICDCGGTTNVRAGHLIRGAIKSCRCLLGEKRPKNTAFNMLYSRYKRSSFRRKLEFTLSKSEFTAIVTQNCHYCGAFPTQKSLAKSGKYAAKDLFLYNGIDRINSLVGYTIENIVPCCGICNRAKYTMSYEDFKNWINSLSLLSKKGKWHG